MDRTPSLLKRWLQRLGWALALAAFFAIAFWAVKTQAHQGTAKASLWAFVITFSSIALGMVSGCWRTVPP